MGAEYTFYDYVDEDGINVIKTWLEARGGKARFDTIIQYLEASRPGTWRRPVVGRLTGECAGLSEIRAQVRRTQLRLLGFYGPGEREFTLVFGAVEKNDRFVPLSACEQAFRRKDRVNAAPDISRKEHDFG